MRQIAFYGKGGIGKSTTTSNVSASLATLGYRVMQIGCDPKADSTATLTSGKRIPNILDTLREMELKEQSDIKHNEVRLEDLVYKGYMGVYCCEAGGPEPGVGCAGRGIITAMEMLQDFNAFEIFNPEYVLYDVLGDVVCGGFAMPIRKGLAKEIYVVTSGEMMSLYACNNIFRGIQKFANTGDARVGGIVINSRGTQHEEELIHNFAEITNSKVLHCIPRDQIVQQSELSGKTTLEYDIESSQTQSYMELGRKIVSNTTRDIPTPMTANEFTDWAKECHDKNFLK